MNDNNYLLSRMSSTLVNPVPKLHLAFRIVPEFVNSNVDVFLLPLFCLEEVSFLE